MARIVVVGSANMDLVVASERLPKPGETLLGGRFDTVNGGKGANQAVAAARAGGSVAFVGCIGDDEYGTRLRAGLEAEAIDVSGLARIDGPSGVALIVTAAGDDNMIVVAPGANSALTRDRIDFEAFDDVRLVLAQLETPLDGVVRAAELARARNACFILDPAPASQLPGDLLSQVDWLTPNESEARMLLGIGDDAVEGFKAARLLVETGVGGVVLKLGVRGAILLEAGRPPLSIPAHAVDPVDTTAAGDAFNGAFAVALGEGAEPSEAVRFAIAASALAVTRRGAQSAMATRAEIDRFRREAALTDRPGM